MPPQFDCPFCEQRTHHPRDVREGYCPRCHVFVPDVREALTMAIARCKAGRYSTVRLPHHFAAMVLQSLLRFYPPRGGTTVRLTNGEKINGVDIPLMVAELAEARILRAEVPLSPEPSHETTPAPGEQHA